MLAAFTYLIQLISYISSSSSKEVLFQKVVLVSALLHNYSSKPLLIPQMKEDTNPREKYHSLKGEKGERGFTETLLPDML